MNEAGADPGRPPAAEDAQPARLLRHGSAAAALRRVAGPWPPPGLDRILNVPVTEHIAAAEPDVPAAHRLGHLRFGKVDHLPQCRRRVVVHEATVAGRIAA